MDAKSADNEKMQAQRHCHAACAYMTEAMKLLGNEGQGAHRDTLTRAKELISRLALQLGTERHEAMMQLRQGSGDTQGLTSYSE